MLILSILFQISFFQSFTVFEIITPNLLLIFTVYWSTKKGFYASLFWVFGSIFLDLFSGLPFGVIMLSLLGVSFLTSQLLKIFISEVNFKILMILVSTMALVYQILIAGILSFLSLVSLSDITIDVMYLITRYIPLSILINLILFLITYPLLERFLDWVSLYEKHQLGKIKRF